jgi:transposase
LEHESDSCAVEKQQEGSMRGSDLRTGELFSYVDLEQRVPESHPLRLIRRIVNEVLAVLDGEFGKLYAAEGRPSIAPERLLRALLLQAFYSIRSERQLMEQLHYNLLYRWFVGLGVDDRVWVPTVFTKNRDRLLEAEVVRKFLAVLLAHRQVRALLSDDHFSVDGSQPLLVAHRSYSRRCTKRSGYQSEADITRPMKTRRELRHERKSLPLPHPPRNGMPQRHHLYNLFRVRLIRRITTGGSRSLARPLSRWLTPTGPRYSPGCAWKCRVLRWANSNRARNERSGRCLGKRLSTPDVSYAGSCLLIRNG